MPYQKVEICGVNTAKLPVLKENEKIALIKKARAGDTEARNDMIQGNLRLVLSIVQKFMQRGENPDDLFQVGCIGLMKAIDNFNPDYELRFSTYGQPMIVGEIRRFLRDNNSVRVSRSMRDIAYKAMQAKEALQKQNNKEPSAQQIADYLQMPKATVTIALESIVEPVSLNEPVYNDNGDAMYVMDQVGDWDCEENWISSIQLRDVLQKLTEREKKIMSLRFLAGKTQTQVAQFIGISQAQVSRLEKNALARIKSEL